MLEEVSVNEEAGQLEVCAEMISQGPLLQSVLLGVMPQEGSARGKKYISFIYLNKAEHFVYLISVVYLHYMSWFVLVLSLC